VIHTSVINLELRNGFSPQHVTGTISFSRHQMLVKQLQAETASTWAMCLNLQLMLQFCVYNLKITLQLCKYNLLCKATATT